MARNDSRMKGFSSMLQMTRGYIGGLGLWVLLVTGCGPSAVCTSDSECQDRFGPYSACILSGERGLCYVDEDTAQKSKRDDVNFPLTDGGDNIDPSTDAGPGEQPMDGGPSFEDAGPGGDGDSGWVVEHDAGEPEDDPVPPQIEFFEVDQSDFFVEQGVLVQWQVSGADACILFQDEEENVLAAEDLATGTSRFFPTQSVSFTLKCTHSIGERTASVQSESITVTPFPAVQITSLRANDLSNTLRINETSPIRIHWTSEYASSCFWSWQTEEDNEPEETQIENEALAEGELTFNANTPGIFQLRCLGNGPASQASVVVELASISSFTSQAPLIAAGESTLLQWTLENSDDNCEINDGENWVSVDEGLLSVSPSQSTTYQLRCAGAGGLPLKASVDVRVLRIESFSSTSESVRYGQSVTLAWQSHEASSCDVLKNDSLVFAVPNDTVSNGEYPSGSLYENASFVLRCRDGAVVVDSEEITVVIEVTITDFSARIDPNFADTIRLSWTAEATRYSQKCSLDGFMGFLTDQVEFPQSNPGAGPVTTYTLTCYGDQGAQLTDQATVKVIWESASEVDEGNWEHVEVVMGNLFLESTHAAENPILQSLKDVGGSLVVQSPSFRTLSLPELRMVYGGMRISESEVLEEIRIPQLLAVGGELEINGNTALTTINVPSLAAVEGDFRLSSTGSSASLHLDSLTRITGELEISNSQLDSLTGISALRNVEGEYLRITSNPGLSCAEIDAFYCALDPTRPVAWVNNNESGSCTLSCTP